MADTAADLPNQLRVYLARMQKRVADQAKADVHKALAAPGSQITKSLQDALLPVCGHVLDQRIMELVQAMIELLQSEAIGPATDKTIFALIDRIAAGGDATLPAATPHT